MESKKNNLESNSKFSILIIGICISFLVIILVSFVSFSKESEKVIEKKVEGGIIELKYNNKFAGLEVVNLTPLTDSIALKDDTLNNYLDFSVDTSFNEAASIDYEISILKDPSKSSIGNEDIRISLEKDIGGSYEVVCSPSSYIPLNEKDEYGVPAGSMVLTNLSKRKNSSDQYRLKLWLSDKSMKSVGSFKVYLKIYSKAK
ncbi:MAG: hypothetical protein IKE70_05640 [Bacilli bacterium]|nr:hypothetical protein [Bacilli bacterium]